MNNYEIRLLKFLQANPGLKMTTRQIAGVWKRAEHDVWYAAQVLFQKGKIKVGNNKEVILKTCEGIGGA